MILSPCCSIFEENNRVFWCSVCIVCIFEYRVYHSKGFGSFKMSMSSQMGVSVSFKMSESFKLIVFMCTCLCWVGLWLWCPCMRGGELIGCRRSIPDRGGDVRWSLVKVIGDRLFRVVKIVSRAGFYIKFLYSCKNFILFTIVIILFHFFYCFNHIFHKRTVSFSSTWTGFH